jgi:hypothetical protein
MKPAGAIEDDGQKALAHSRAVQIMAHGFGEKDTHLGRAILVTRGHYALDMNERYRVYGKAGPGRRKISPG